MSYGWLVGNTVDDCLQRQIAKKKSKLVLSTLVTAWLSNIAFHLLSIWLQTLGTIDSESRLTLFSNLCEQLSEVAVLFKSNLSRRPFLRQVVDLDLLLWTGFYLEHAVLFLCHFLTQRPMTDRKVERIDGRGFGRQQVTTTSRKFHRNFHFA